MANGFEPVAQESYVGVADVVVYKRHLLSWIKVDTQNIRMAALEFGK